MREIGAAEAKNKLGTLLACVERGEEVLITRRGKAVARLVPAVAASRSGGDAQATGRAGSRVTLVLDSSVTLAWCFAEEVVGQLVGAAPEELAPVAAHRHACGLEGTDFADPTRAGV